MSVSVFEGAKKSWLELCFQSILGWLRVFVGMADHSKASNSSNQSDLSANQKLNRKCFGFRHNNKTRFGSSDLEKNTLSSTFKRPSPTHRSNQSSLTPLIALIVFLAVISPAKVEAVVQWTAPTGPVGGSVNVIAVDSVNSSVMYAGTNYGGLFKSVNGGINWEASNKGLGSGGSVSGIAVDPINPSILYIGTGAGVFKSANSGVSWLSVNAGLGNGSDSIESIVIDPLDSLTLYAGTNAGKVFKSTNGGASWVAASVGLNGVIAGSIAINPLNPLTLYVSTLGGVFKSTNGGNSWVLMSKGLNARWWGGSISIDPLTPTTLYVVNKGVFKSTDGGANWVSANKGLTSAAPMGVVSIGINPLTPTILYAGTSTGSIFKSIDSGANWGFTVVPKTVDIRSIAFSSLDPATLYAGGYGGGVFKSTDSGASWIAMNNGLVTSSVQTVAIDPMTSGTLYAGTWGGDVSKSLDGGASWTSLNLGLNFQVNINSIAIDPLTPSTLYIGINGGVLKSTDGGLNWLHMNKGLTLMTVTTIAIDPVTPRTIYAGTWRGGVFKSTDGGANWVSMGKGLPATATVQAIVIDPLVPATIYLGTDTGVFKSINAGGAWAAMNNGLPTTVNIQAIAIAPLATSTTLYVGTWNGGVFKSTNSGNTWTAMNTGLLYLNVKSIAIDLVNPTKLYLGTWGGGIYTSINGGRSWVASNKGIGTVGIYVVSIGRSEPSTPYVGILGRGVSKGVNLAASITKTAITKGPIPSLPYNFSVTLSAPLPTGYYIAVNFDNQQGGWFQQQQAGGHIKLLKRNPTSYSLNYALNKPGLRSFQAGVFNSSGQLVGAYANFTTCLTQTCLATIERTNNIGIPSTRGSQQFKNVDVASGNYYFSSTDMSVPGGKGPSFNLTRSYNSLGMKSVIKGTNLTNPNPLTMKDYNVKPGPWTFAHDMNVRFMNDQLETGLTTNTNRKIVLGSMEDGSLLYYFKDMDQLWYTLTPGNFKQLIQNANGSFTLYSQGDRIYQFADPAGAAKGRLNRIENRAGLALTYIYNASNVLTSVTDANNKSYTFTHVGSTLRVTDFTGRFVEYTFDANGMISQVRNMRGKFYRYTYGATGANIYRIATIRDPRNTATAQISLTSENIIGRVLSLVDGAGKLTGFQYGKANVGNPVKAEPATGITRPKVDGLNHNLVYILDKTRSKVKKRIDAKSYAQGVTIAASDIVTSHAYKTAASRNELADNSLVITTDDPNKNHTDIAYDPAVGGGRPQTISNAVVGNTAQRTSTATYTRIPAQVNLKPVATVQQSGVAAATQYQRFTPTGKAQDITDPAGNKTTRVFDASDQMTQTSNPRQTLNPALGNTQYTYDAAGNLTQITDALGNKTIKTYDILGLGRIKTELSPLGLTTTYTYDANGNVLTRIETGAGGINYKTTNTYDANDNLLSTTDPMLLTTNYTYDNMNRKSGESYTVGALVYTKSYTYDPIGRLTSVTNERGLTSQTHYTSRSQVKYKVDPSLKTIVTYTYDKNGNVTTVTDAENRTITTTYDALNRKIQAIDSKGNIQKWTYNPAGQIATYLDARSQLTQYTYDAVGNITKLIDAKNGITTSTYDANGNVLTVTDPNTHTTTYAYDALDRRTSTTLHDGRKWTYTYDANGNMLTAITPTGEKAVKTYDPLNRMTSLKEYAANSPTITRNIIYTYDANGNVLKEMNGAKSIAYTYDKINRVTSVTDQFGKSIAYGYDKVGNRTSLIYPGNKTITYTYDKNDRLKNLTDWLGKTTTYTRNFAGQVTQVLNGNGSKATYTFDTAGRLTNLTNLDRPGATISSHAMTLDGAGNITKSTMNIPLLPTMPPSTGTMAYDITNRLTSSGTSSYTPDMAGRTITESKGASQTIYSFDINDHITSITRGATTLSSYAYDMKNNRISQTQNGTETRYVIDQLASLPNVIAEMNNLGTISTYYIYGEGLVSQITAAGVSHYYHYDPTGHTLALSDGATGLVTDTFAYAPYGFTTSTGATHNPFKFVGKFGVMDDGNGLHYMRARYYKEDIKRFVSLDALHGDIMTPQKLNRYAYVLGNPVMGIDPSGLAAEYGSLKYKLAVGFTNTYSFIKNAWKKGSANTLIGVVVNSSADILVQQPSDMVVKNSVDNSNYSAFEFIWDVGTSGIGIPATLTIGYLKKTSREMLKLSNSLKLHYTGQALSNKDLDAISEKMNFYIDIADVGINMMKLKKAPKSKSLKKAAKKLDQLISKFAKTDKLRKKIKLFDKAVKKYTEIITNPKVVDYLKNANGIANKTVNMVQQ